MRIFAAVGLAIAAASALAQVDPGRVVVTVNGDEIKGSEYYEHMEYMENVGRMLDSGKFVPVSPGLLSLVELVNQHLYLQLAKQKNLYPTDAEVDGLIKETMVDDPHLIDRWVATGRTQQALREQERLVLAQFKLQTEGITVSDQEVSDFYHNKAIPGLTVAPRTVTFRLISVNDADSEKAVDADLAGGKTFADVAQARSTDITKNSGGKLGPIPTDALPKDVAAALDKTKVGDSSTWVDEKVGDGDAATVFHVKYLVLGKEPEKPLPFDQYKDQIRRSMMLDRGRARNDVEKEISDLRQSSKIDIKNKEYATSYVIFMKSFYHETIHLGG